MTDNFGTHRMFENWKRQVEAGVRAMDAVVEATARMRTAQLEAANETHQRALELEQKLASAMTAQELWQVQWEWTLACGQRSAEYWRHLFEAMSQAGGGVARCVQDGLQEGARQDKPA
jgi:hypothetical protein